MSTVNSDEACRIIDAFGSGTENNIWTEIQKARAENESAMAQLRALLERLPPGADNQAVASALAHVVGAGVALSFREPAVPFSLAFVSP